MKTASHTSSTLKMVTTRILAILKSNKKLFTVALVSALMSACVKPTPTLNAYNHHAIHHKDHRVYLNQDQSAILYIGGIRMSSSADIKHLIEMSGKVKSIVLISYGGDVASSFTMSKLFAKNELDTYAYLFCDSACPVAFSGGVDRYLAKDSVLGFHSSRINSTGYGNSPYVSRYVRHNNKRIARFLVKNGVDKNFADKALNIDSDDIWEPRISQLRQSKIITKRLRSNDSIFAMFPKPIIHKYLEDFKNSLR